MFSRRFPANFSLNLTSQTEQPGMSLPAVALPANERQTGPAIGVTIASLETAG
jgi:hypothetical protein